MKNKRLSKYSQLSNLQDIAAEKARLKKLVKAQGGMIEADWDEVYSFWSFVPKVARTVNYCAICDQQSEFHLLRRSFGCRRRWLCIRWQWYFVYIQLIRRYDFCQ